MSNRILPNLSINTRPLLLVGLTAGLLALAACQPVRDPAVVAAERTAIASGAVPAAPADAATPIPASEVPGIGPAQVTISTDRLRVRALPSEDAEIVARVEEGTVHPVVGISSDGAWLQIEVDEAPEGTGWVSAEFVTLAGDITNIPIVEVPVAAATAEPTEEPTAEPTEEPTAEPTEEPTAEPTEEPTAEPTEEPTAEPTEEPTAEPTEEPTAEPTEEPTAEPTEEPTAEPTEEPTAEPTEEPTAEPTEEPTAEPTEEPAEEGATADLGTVTVDPDLDLPLRVRSEPTDEEENKIGNVYAGETYPVLEVSEDGLWVRIEVPDMGDGSGWVSAEFVVFNEAP